MVKRSPAEVYVRYLLCHPDGYNNAAVKEQMDELELFCPLGSELDKLRKKYRPPSPFYPKNRTHVESMRFLRDSGIYSLFFPDSSTQYALSILRNRPVRSIVEQLLHQNAKYDMIVRLVQQKHNFPCSIDGVRKYEYIFDSKEALRIEKRQALDVTLSGWATSRDKDVTAAHIDAEKYAKFDDPRRLSLSMPNCPASQRLIAIRNGYVPKASDYNVAEEMPALMQMLLDYASMRVAEGKPKAAQEAREAIAAFKDLLSAVDQMKRPDQTVREQLSDIHLKSDEDMPKTVAQLASGDSHTIDLQPIGKTDAVEVESAAGTDDDDVEELEK